MKHLGSILTSAIILCIIITPRSQDIQLTSGSKTKTIQAGKFIEVERATPYPQPCSKCPINAVAGKLVSYADGKLAIQTKHVREPLVEGESQTGSLFKNYKNENMPTLIIPGQEVLSIKVLGKKKIKRATTGQTIGRLIFMFGLSNMISAPVAGIESGQSGDLLLKLGAIEVATGMIINAVFEQKVYYTSQNSSQEGHGNKIWVLN